MSFAVGETVGPYRILEQLGQGGMATVYKAYHPSLDRYVAIKALHPAFKEDPNFLARFQREARVVAKLEHPNIVPVYDFAEHEGRPYLVMKFIEGETLKARLNRGPIDRAEVVRIVESVGAALTYAHRSGILHRDVKPSNVILANDTQIYLADFGLARIAAAGESTLSTDMLVGTPQYISPEQAKGNRDLDEGTDIYSFGVLLYEMVVGRVPFNADTPYSIIHDHIFTPLPLPRKINPNVPEAVERVLLKALAKERPDRYADVAGLVEAFKAGMSVSTNISPVSVPEEVAAPTVIARPVDIPQEPVLIENIQESEQVPIMPAAGRITEQRKSGKGKKALFILIPFVLIVVCFCGLITLRAINRNQGRVVGEATAQLSPLDQTLQVVEQNPDDPWAHYQLSLALSEDGQREQALQELNQSLNLAGENYDFYMQTGADLAARNAWPQAAQVYVRLMQVHPRPVPAEITTRLNEALYKAAAVEDFFNVVSLDTIAEVAPPITPIVRTRHVLYFEGPVRARALLTGLSAVDKSIPEERLLEAEASIRFGSPEEAIPILDGLIQNIDLPEWIRAEAQSLLDQIGK
jgi:predicted Ser/Thr protein kinase